MTKGHVFSTGNEVLSGDTVDTNSAFLCRQLKCSGVTVIKTSAVPDDMTALVSEIKSIASAVDVCVMTGGLGPTSDDLTAEALAKAAGVKSKLYTAALNSMKKYFDKKMNPGQFIRFIYQREGEAKITIMCDEELVKVMRVEAR